MAKTYCPWCHAPADWIDTRTTKCPECLAETSRTSEGAKQIEQAQLVSRQTAEGINAYLRGRRLRTEISGDSPGG